jgi:hypothetical protein
MDRVHMFNEMKVITAAIHKGGAGKSMTDQTLATAAAYASPLLPARHTAVLASAKRLRRYFCQSKNLPVPAFGHSWPALRTAVSPERSGRGTIFLPSGRESNKERTKGINNRFLPIDCSDQSCKSELVQLCTVAEWSECTCSRG